MQFQIPISTIFNQVFGIAEGLTKTYNVPQNNEKVNYPGYNIQLGEKADEQTLLSQLGTPIQFPMGFTAGDYNFRKNGRIEKKTMAGIYLPFTSVASFSQASRITETYMSGQNGSVIEEYGFEPWEIRVQGLIIKNDKSLVFGDSTVEDQVRELKSYRSLSDKIGVKGRLFEVLDIHKVAILDIQFPQAKNYNIEVVRPYEMRLRSVEPIELLDV